MSSAVAAVIDVPGGEFRLESVELDDLRDDEILVRVEACGVCHTDVEAQGKMTPLPAVMGHEGAGTVEAVGRCVRRVRPGDRVVVSYPSCGTCENCAAGRCDSQVHKQQCVTTAHLFGRRFSNEPFAPNHETVPVPCFRSVVLAGYG